MKIYTYNIDNLTSFEYQKWLNLLSFEKKKRINRVKIEKNRKCTVAGEMLARKGIAQAMNVSPEIIIFEKNQYGKPYAKNLDIHFNISHCENMVVCAIGETELGIDIEKVRPINLKIAEKICLENELEYIFENSKKNYQTQENNILRKFFEIWTGKEAYFKCTGTGITDFKIVDTLNDPILNQPIYMGDFIIRTAKKSNI